MQTTIHKNIAALARLCAEKGITDVVLSPGSRNAPISIAMNREAGLRCHVVVDERCAAFVALGMAQKSNRCVATVCTSGTALLNQAPAIAEAYYQELPLLVISADRPEEWIDQADSQTIRQNGILASFVKKSYTLPTNASASGHWHTNRMVNEAINTATSGRRGPVHLNVPCNLPLYATEEQEVATTAITRTCETTVSLNEIPFKRIMVLAGCMQPSEELNSLANQLAGKGVAVMAECVSNLHGPQIANNTEPVFASLTEEEAANENADLLIVVGGALVSKHAKLHFRTHPAKEIWRVGLEEHLTDTFQHATRQITCAPATLLKALNEQVSGCSGFNRFWLERSQAVEPRPGAQEWSEDGIFRTITDSLPNGSDLHLSNGTCARNGQKWNNRKGLHYYCNRGASGIDGCTSTALGSALMNKGARTTLITGDLCFLYDSNALWNDEWPENLCIFVINNHGGGIFRKLEGPSQVEEFERYFLTPQRVDIERLCQAYGVPYQKAENMTELAFYAEHYPKGVIEVEV